MISAGYDNRDYCIDGCASSSRFFKSTISTSQDAEIGDGGERFRQVPELNFKSGGENYSVANRFHHKYRSLKITK
jgi:hypothetical protein